MYILEFEFDAHIVALYKKRKMQVKPKQFTTAKISINFYRLFATFQKKHTNTKFQTKKKK